MMNSNIWIELSYLASVILFISGLKRLSHPLTARSGNLWAAAGMILAIIATLILPLPGSPNNYTWIIAALAVGTGIGYLMAKRVQMTSMPELVSIFNGLGGACAMVISMLELNKFQASIQAGSEVAMGTYFTTLLALFIGTVAFTGSLIAYGKLDGRINDQKVRIPQSTLVNLILLLVALGAIVYNLLNPIAPANLLYGILGISLIYGITFVIPIGGADMPVVISLLNAFTGIAAALAGIVYGNLVMVVGGILVGSSGTILTILMCQAMNRSLFNVIIGGFGSTGTAAKGSGGDQVAKEINANDAAILLNYAQSVIIVPGYGMAVARAQKTCRELEQLLSKNGVEVNYAIHPVAGRMPGHMNVLLAEADVPYTQLLDLDDANSALKDADVVIIAGANDVVNPSAEDDPSSSIYGMPILKVLDAKNTIVMKRSMRPGYAGIQNPLFFHEKNRMLFGDAKDSFQKLIDEVKTLM